MFGLWVRDNITGRIVMTERGRLYAGVAFTAIIVGVVLSLFF